MALLHALGVLDTAHDLSNGTAQSENVIDLGAAGIDGYGPGMNNIFLDLECETADSGGAGDTYSFRLCVDDTEALTSPVYYILQVDLVNGDPRIDAAGNKIYTGAIPDQVWQMAKEGYRYLGMEYVCADVGGTAGVSVNCAITAGAKPRTEDNVQVTRSNVTKPS